MSLLLRDSHLEYLQGGLERRIYLDPTSDSLVRGVVGHSAGCTVVLTPDDCEQVGYDLDTCSGIVAQRLATIMDGDTDWSDPDEV